MKKISILIVEDEAIVAADLAAKLKRLGYEVAGMAASGEDAVAMAVDLRPDLILMDILLKGAMDGIEAAESIRGKHDAPVIYLTAHSDAATLARAKTTGPFGYILKPFDERDLATQIEVAIYKHQVDREIKAQREWLRVTLTSIGDAVIATDAEGRITFANPLAEALTGWKADEALGRSMESVFRIVNEQTGEALKEGPVETVLREGHAVALANHTAIITKDGRFVPIEDSAAPILDAGGKMIGAVLVFHDVTEKRRAAEALRQSAQFPKENPNPVMRCAIEGDILYANAPARHWLATFGWRAGGSLPAPVRIAVAEARDQAGPIEAEITNPEDLTLSVFAVQPPGEEYVNLYGMDITERKRAEDELRKSKENLEIRVKERTTELEAMNTELQDFTHVASHDLREPLRKILTFTDMLSIEANDSLDAASAGYVRRMRKSAERMQELLDSLLDYSRLSTENRTEKETDLKKSVEVALSNLEVMIKEKGALIEVGDLPAIVGDRIQMVQLFQNLIQNAIKFQRNGVAPRIKIYMDRTGSHENKACAVCVEDNGIGMDNKYLDRIFSPFQRLHGRSEYGGAGMGLAICSKIVKRHGGAITVKSELNKGATFTVSLPAERIVR